MNSENWMDKLAALRAGMGAEEPQPEPEPVPADVPARMQSGRLDIILDRKGRAGKSATIISGFTIGSEAVAELVAVLRRSLGTGGSWRDTEILIQGDRRQDVQRLLSARGFKARIIL